jgi:fucose permease
MFGFLAVFFAILCGAFLFTRPPAITPVEQAADGTERSLPALVLCCLLALVAVGVETAIGNWIPTLAFRSTGDHRAISLAGSLFWIGILAGRLVATRTMKSVSPVTLSVASSLLAALSVLFLTRSHGLAAICAGAFLVSFWISPVYPATIARGAPLRGRRLIFVTAGLGSSFLPWMTGLVSDRSGSLRVALAVPAVGCILLAGLFLADMKLFARQRRTATEAGG